MSQSARNSMTPVMASSSWSVPSRSPPGTSRRGTRPGPVEARARLVRCRPSSPRSRRGGAVGRLAAVAVAAVVLVDSRSSPLGSLRSPQVSPKVWYSEPAGLSRYSWSQAAKSPSSQASYSVVQRRVAAVLARRRRGWGRAVVLSGGVGGGGRRVGAADGVLVLGLSSSHRRGRGTAITASEHDHGEDAAADQRGFLRPSSAASPSDPGSAGT